MGAALLQALVSPLGHSTTTTNSSLHTGIHVALWNLSFPSQTERILWRTARLNPLVRDRLTAASWILEMLAPWVPIKRCELPYIVMYSRHLAHFGQELKELGNSRDHNCGLVWCREDIPAVGGFHGAARD